MKNSIDKFEIELNGLLKRYFNDDELNRLNLNDHPPKDGSDKITGLIKDFYRNQLHGYHYYHKNSVDLRVT